MALRASTETVVGRRGPVKVGPDGRQQRAAGAVRISEGGQSQYSAGTQREAILARAHGDGYAMDEADLYVDYARGHKLTRTGYQAILRGVRAGRYAAVYCFMLDRWGRDSIERQQRGKELDRLGVPVISLLEGTDEPGVVRAVRAEMAEEEGRRNARRVMPNRERAAREGHHMGATPWGYRRVFGAWDGTGRRPAGTLTPHEVYAKEVRSLFSRYASGQWSTRELAADLNARGIPAPSAHWKRRPERPRPVWSTATVCGLLANPVYRGDVAYNQRAGLGHYVPTPSSPGFVVAGKHEALVDRDVFETVQRRLREARTSGSVARKTAHAHLVAGLLRCRECGGPMIPSIAARDSARSGQMRCADRHEGRSACTAPSYKMDLAEAALLDAVCALRGRPWKTAVEDRLRGENAGALAALQADVVAKKAELKRAMRNFRMLENPGAAELEIINETRAELDTEIARLEAQVAALAGDAGRLGRLKALHARLRTNEVRDLVQRARALGEKAEPELRDLLCLVVESATVVERVPETRSTWLRLQVTWQPDVAALLDEGLLWLDESGPSAQRPPQPDARTLARRERQRRYRAHRAGLLTLDPAPQPPRR